MAPDLCRPGGARLIRQSDGGEFPLNNRLTTIGSSPQCGIVISGADIPRQIGHVLFSDGAFSLAIISRDPPVFLNGAPVRKTEILSDDDRLDIGKDSLRFSSGRADPLSPRAPDASPLRRFIAALSSFTRSQDGDARFELLSGIAQILRSDGARLVAEDAAGALTTIARFPQTSGLDRFSERAILWAKKQAATVLMHDDEWRDADNAHGSLETNQIGSILCTPLFEGTSIRGYLYLDKKRDKAGFSEQDREILEDVGPVFGDLLALHDRTLRQRETIARLQKNLETRAAPIIYGCDAMRRAIDLALTFAPADSTVLLTGETGTGKELFARFIHDRSNRSAHNFCVINCGALPENLIESELFGHEKGAFTGAYQKKAGLFEHASGGTVFLDEIGEMPLHLQVKLLRVLQESEMTPVGATASVKVDVRVIAATNRDLRAEVTKGRFREDLFYRLGVLEIDVPALRDRHRDALLLADYFIKKYTQRFGLPEKALSLPAQAKLLAHQWPGNVRELENIVQKALLLSKGGLIGETELDLPAQEGLQTRSAPGGDQPGTAGKTLKEARVLAEIKCIRDALDRANGNISVAARLLDTDRKWVTKLMKLHGISVPGKAAG